MKENLTECFAIHGEEPEINDSSVLLCLNSLTSLALSLSSLNGALIPFIRPRRNGYGSFPEIPFSGTVEKNLEAMFAESVSLAREINTSLLSEMIPSYCIQKERADDGRPSGDCWYSVTGTATSSFRPAETVRKEHVIDNGDTPFTYLVSDLSSLPLRLCSVMEQVSLLMKEPLSDTLAESFRISVSGSMKTLTDTAVRACSLMEDLIHSYECEHPDRLSV